MKFSFAKAAAAATIAAAALIVAPAAAQATTYTPSVTGTVAPGGVVTFAVTGGFTPGETVNVTLTGENASGAQVLAAVKFVYQSGVFIGTATALSDGSISARIQLPADASGTYTVTGTGVTSGFSSSQNFTVASGSGGASSGLPATGIDSGSLLGIWIGGGALLLVGGGLAVAGTVRRGRKQTA